MKLLSEPLLGLRLIVLSVVAGSAVFLPAVSQARGYFVFGILAGLLFGVSQYACDRWKLRFPSEVFILAQVGVWTYLVHLSDGQRSPLFIGYLLEVPLAAMQIGRRGAVLAASAGAIAYLVYCSVLSPPLEMNSALLVVGFLVTSVVLSWLLLDLLERQRRTIDAAHDALRSRAENLADELRLLGDYLEDALLVVDDLGRIESINPAAAEVCGVERGAALGRAWQEVIRSDRDGIAAIARTIAEGRAERGLPITLECRDGRRVSARAEVWAGLSAEGRKTYLLLDARPPVGDETDPLRRLGEAVACVSHQIKNSIHALQGLASGVEAAPGFEGRGSVRELRSALRGLGSLAEDMLAMSGAPRARDESVPLREILSSALVLSRRSVGHQQVGDGFPEVRVCGHRGELVHALFNLLDNAGRASPPGAAVRVSVSVRGAHAITEIEDSGPGLPPGVEHARVPAASRNGSGYGLLAARRFLESNSGELWFERLAQGGTRCRVRLTIAPPTKSPGSSGLTDALAPGGVT